MGGQPCNQIRFKSGLLLLWGELLVFAVFHGLAPFCFLPSRYNHIITRFTSAVNRQSRQCLTVLFVQFDTIKPCLVLV
uniref:Phospholamban n=1 Tax=Myoviridae sp. ctuev19 TaxID=2827716 RepID=A0A8S5SG57_9CAUD|nr:MAG TPA: Phospholamban [Myoviridae sp. ctuev19]